MKISEIPRGLSVAAIILFSLLSIHAQSPLPVPPLEPLLKAPPTDAEWTISYQFNGSVTSGLDAQQNPIPWVTKVNVVKSDGIRREIFSWNDGRTTERWYYQGFLLSDQREGSAIIVQQIIDDPLALSAENDFQNLEWVPMAKFIRVERSEGKWCYLFEESGESRKRVDGSEIKPRRIWIDGVSRLPVAVKSEGLDQAYNFTESSSGALELPERFQRALRLYNEEIIAQKRHQMKI